MVRLTAGVVETLSVTDVARPIVWSDTTVRDCPRGPVAVVVRVVPASA